MILIAIGANLPRSDGLGPLGACRWAAGRLDGLLGLRLRGLSRWYDSAPVPPSDQPPYVNGMAHLGGRADPGMLLHTLHALEAEAGRLRTRPGAVPNAARCLDLDVIAMNGLVRSAPDPIVPHPRAHLRAFVLLPLLDVAPGWKHPKYNLSPREMLATLPEQEIRAIPD